MSHPPIKLCICYILWVLWSCSREYFIPICHKEIVQLAGFSKVTNKKSKTIHPLNQFHLLKSSKIEIDTYIIIWNKINRRPKIFYRIWMKHTFTKPNPIVDKFQNIKIFFSHLNINIDFIYSYILNNLNFYIIKNTIFTYILFFFINQSFTSSFKIETFLI